MIENSEKSRRKRRSKNTLEIDVLNAVTSLIEEVGFANVTLTAVAQRAQIEPSVFYRRYANLDELFDQYTHKFDYWFGNIAEQIPADLNDEDIYKWLMRSLINALYKNKGMQQLLIWELSDRNPITRRTANTREMINMALIRMLEARFEGTGIDMNVISAMMISGVYYLILHKDISSFCNVDFASKKGKERFEKTIDDLSSILFSELKRRKENIEIADKLRAEGVSEEIIQKCIH